MRGRASSRACTARALFQRGETQAIVTTTLGTSTDEQKIDALTGETLEALHAPLQLPALLHRRDQADARPGPSRDRPRRPRRARARADDPGRRSSSRTRSASCSETLESNGSLVDGRGLRRLAVSLMDAGVPIKSPVAGIAMGLIMRGRSEVRASSQRHPRRRGSPRRHGLQGLRHRAGVTAIQMDIKIAGPHARDPARRRSSRRAKAASHILGKMLETLADRAPGPQSKYAPRITTIKVKPDQIRLIIGPGGKTIKGIIDQTGVAIDVEDDGTVNVASSDPRGREEGARHHQGPHGGARGRRGLQGHRVSASPTSARSSRSSRAPTASSTSRRWRTTRVETRRPT